MSTNKYSAPAAACAADLLNVLARSEEPLSLAEIARRLNRSKSLVFRVAKELETRDFIRESGEGRFWLGIETLELGGSYISQSDYTEAARSVLQKLSHETGETVNLGTLRGAEVLYLEKWEGANSVVTVSHVGKRIPANCTAMGKALLARLSDEEVAERFGDSYPMLTAASLGSYQALVKELAATRERGYALDLGETLDGRACVAIALESPLAGADEGVAVSISMTSRRFEADANELVNRLTDAGHRLDNEWQKRLVMTGSAASR